MLLDIPHEFPRHSENLKIHKKGSSSQKFLWNIPQEKSLYQLVKKSSLFEFLNLQALSQVDALSCLDPLSQNKSLEGYSN